MKSRVVLSALVLGRMLLGAIPSDAQACQKLFPQNYATQAMSAIRIVPGGDNFSVAAGTAAALNDALAQWNTVCGSNVPTLSKTASSSVTFQVNYMKGVYNRNNSMNACGITDFPIAGTVLGGGTIWLFEETRNGGDCTNSYKVNTMHEIGHRLGLDHSNCSNNLMFSAPEAWFNPVAADCSAVDNFWRSSAEPLPPPPPECFWDGNCLGSRRYCVYPRCVECKNSFHCNQVVTTPGTLSFKFEGAQFVCTNYVCVAVSPLLLYLPDYTSSGKPQNWWRNVCDPDAPTVCLDWRGDGNITCTGWTEPDNKDIGFLAALSEVDLASLTSRPLQVVPSLHLFGNITRGPDGGFPFQHGFAALASFCGQSGASEIDLSSCGKRLVVWVDNGDGAISADELQPFDALGIQSLGKVRGVGKRDQCGNQDLFESHAKCSGQPGRCGTWIDIFFAPEVAE